MLKKEMTILPVFLTLFKHILMSYFMRMILIMSKKEMTILPVFLSFLTYFEAWEFYNLIGMGMRLRIIMFRDMTDVDDDYADDDYEDDADDDNDYDDNDNYPGT